MDPHQPPGGDAERKEKLAALVLRRSALTKEETALFREVFPDIFHLHKDPVWAVIRRQGARDAALQDLVQDVFVRFYNQTVEQGFPESIPVKLHGIAATVGLNYARGQRREPVSLGLPSSSKLPPRSATSAEGALYRRKLAQRLLPALSKEHRDVIVAILVCGLTHEEAAIELGIPRTTVSSRLIKAKLALVAMAALFFPPSQQGA
jgi:RNA polymerase sigma factor (sigma-70 family)